MINPTKTNPLNQNIELGKIAWYRDYDQALAESTRLNKPIFLLFTTFKTIPKVVDSPLPFGPKMP